MGTFFRCDTNYDTDQTAVNAYLVLLLTCTLTAANVCLDTMLICYCLLNTIIVIIIDYFVVRCCIYFASDQYIASLHTSIGTGIARDQYY